MTDPKFQIGDHVIFEGKPAVVQHMLYFDGALEPEQFMGYQLGFDDGSFSGWHPESTLTAVMNPNEH